MDYFPTFRVDIRVKNTSARSNRSVLVPSSASSLSLWEDVNKRNMSQSRDGAYRRAMNLMSMRCHSNEFGPPSSAASLRYTRTPLIDTSATPFGANRRRFFYVDQTKPVPMKPLKAWRGYEGNVYFEPIKVYKVEREDNDKLYRVKSTKNRLLTIDRTTSKTPTSGRSTVKGHRKMAILDRDYILGDTGCGNNTGDDIVWLVGQSSTGSLRMADGSGVQGDGPAPNHAHQPTTAQDIRICRGSVAHRLYEMQRRGETSGRSLDGEGEAAAKEVRSPVEGVAKAGGVTKAGGVAKPGGVADRSTLSVMSTSRTYKNRLLHQRHTNGVQTVR